MGLLDRFKGKEKPKAKHQAKGGVEYINGLIDQLEALERNDAKNKPEISRLEKAIRVAHELLCKTTHPEYEVEQVRQRINAVFEAGS
ncbi:hypothetical protein HN512_00515 [Candidatus Peregrinibacteria bacterium]|jgi:hypothetical protein|nr:hypothetical protein [Candidatus Peregrinibacteria bacterium]MBT3598308.1 hypothetical protein [Candidatus Peregrinibacteria bacterium]MBT4367330.1 hypothetical protein [Candidatus Peregrinibacteria bacterium]MBT4585716.1 hypothetical protein [Candidatus Peregrinibacteria bacterium]MBT6730530.1 hypothetical protein [Candidatus Peregrinibacteria bacterium]